MFNIYTHEKRLKQEKEDLRRKRKEELIEQSRKKKLPVLCNSYEKRIRNFIFEMVDHPITLKEYVVPSTKTTRQDYINDKNRKNGGSSKFSFRKYKTDKERLEEYLLEKAENQKYLDRLKNKEDEKNDSNNCNAKNYHSIEQPIMRYKPRTDLERIYYSVNEYSYGKIPKEIVNEQLSQLHLNDLKKKEDEEGTDTALLDKYKNLDENLIEELQTQKEFLNRQGYNEKNSETVKQIEIILSNYQQRESEIQTSLNRNCNEDDTASGSKHKNKLALKNQINSKAAKKLMGEYNTKTFFKAASVFSFNLNDYKHKDQKHQKRLFNDKNNFNGKGNVNYSTSGDFYKKNSNKGFSGLKNNINSTANNLNLNSINTQASGSVSNRTKSNFYLTFNEMDEPYYDEIQETKQNYFSLTKKTSSNNTRKFIDNSTEANHENQNETDHFNELDNIQTQILRSTKAAFAKTSNSNFFAAESRNIKSLLKPLESNPSVKSNYISSLDYNPFTDNANNNYSGRYYLDEKSDPKSLSYLKKISAYSSLQNENSEEDKKRYEAYMAKDLQIGKNAAKLNCKNLNASQAILNSKQEGMVLRQLTHVDLEDNRKYDEERVTIDDETYLKSQFDLISKKVLKKCNYLHSKSDFNNKVLKSGQGKLMITSGLTINDFAKKFKVPK